METQLKMNISQINTSGHAYFNELESEDILPYSYKVCSTDSRYEKWIEQRKTYGFDETETWDLNHTFYAWLYEHLRMYLDTASEVVNLNFHTFTWENQSYTQLEIIEMILDRIRFYFSEEYDDFSEYDRIYINEIGEMWALVLPAMWW